MSEKKNNKYKIILDTNLVYYRQRDDLGKIFSRSVIDFKNFIDDNKLKNISLVIPEMVFQERLIQRLEDIKETIRKADSIAKSIKCFNAKIDTKDCKNKNYENLLKNRAEKFLKDNNISIMKSTKIDQQVLVDRLKKRTKPFSEKDRGYKDTIIWLSILDDVKNNKNINYILGTNNTRDFDEKSLIKEFRKISKKDFKVIPSIIEIKEYLDSELPLKLKLKELYKQIEEELKRKSGSIMVKVNAFKDSDFNYGMFPYDAQVTAAQVIGAQVISPLLSNGDDKKNFDFKNMEVKNIFDDSDDQHIVELVLTVDEVKENNHPLLDYPMSAIDYFSQDIKLNVNLRYNRKTQQIEIISVIKDRANYMDYMDYMD